MLDPLPRLPRIRRLIEQEKYFVVHAPRQTGKTTTLQAYAAALRAEGTYAAVYATCECASVEPEGAAPAELRILRSISHMARHSELPEECLPPEPWPDAPQGRLLIEGLGEWAARSPKPLVLFLDEVDSLWGPKLESVLRQLRAGHNNRPAPFPQSVAVCGMRDVRDYKLGSGGDATRFGTSSPFNIKESMRLADFTAEHVTELYGQHTAQTGQAFSQRAVQRAFEASQGQPWLVNALAYEVTEMMEVAGPIGDEHMDEAVERLIRARATHLDSLVARLHEPRVQRVIEPMLAGTSVIAQNQAAYHDDVSYVRDLGLVTRTSPLQIANPIYQEVITRSLAAQIEEHLELDPGAFVTSAGLLDVDRLITEFAEFWKRDGDVLASAQGYPEAAAQLVFWGSCIVWSTAGGSWTVSTPWAGAVPISASGGPGGTSTAGATGSGGDRAEGPPPRDGRPCRGGATAVGSLSRPSRSEQRHADRL